MYLEKIYEEDFYDKTQQFHPSFHIRANNVLVLVFKVRNIEI